MRTLYYDPFQQKMQLSIAALVLLAGGDAEADRLKNIEELISTAVEFEKSHDEPTLEAFLEEVALITDIDNYDDDNNAVVLMTILINSPVFTIGATAAATNVPT